MVGPFGAGGGAVGAEIAAYGDGVEELEEEGEGPDENVDGGYGGSDEGEEDGAVEVVGYLVGRRVLVLGLGVGKWGERGLGRGLTNIAAMVLFSHGRLLMPFISGSVNMRYSKRRKPGASIVNQPILPGRLSRDVTDVLPIPYQFRDHCMTVACGLSEMRLVKHPGNILPEGRIEMYSL